MAYEKVHLQLSCHNLPKRCRYDIRMLSGVRRQEGSAVRQGGSLRIADSMA